MLDIAVIGHRGVRSIETENTLSSLRRAVELGAGAVELDIHATKDNRLVALHNRSLRSVYGVNRSIDELTLAEAKKLRSGSGDTIPTLDEILRLKLPVPLMLDIKKTAAAEDLCKFMAKKSGNGQQWFVSTFYWDKIPVIKRLSPKTPLSLATSLRPRLAVKRALHLKAKAITIPVYLLPLSYRRARLARLKVIVYMNYLPFLLTTPMFVASLKKLYPEIIICTDRPDRVVPLLKKA